VIRRRRDRTGGRAEGVGRFTVAGAPSFDECEGPSVEQIADCGARLGIAAQVAWQVIPEQRRREPARKVREEEEPPRVAPDRPRRDDGPVGVARPFEEQPSVDQRRGEDRVGVRDLGLAAQHVHRAHEDRRFVDPEVRDAGIDAVGSRVFDARRVDVRRDERRGDDALELERRPRLAPDPDVDDDPVGAGQERRLALEEPAVEEPEPRRRGPPSQSSVP
jgi:hypothetical protein